jgi:hypothetical protein
VIAHGHLPSGTDLRSPILRPFTSRADMLQPGHYDLVATSFTEPVPMSEAKEAAKVAKKERKLAVKQAKKLAEASPEAPAGPTPAERSAAAAERQVRLQRLRVVLAFLGVAVAAAMLLWTVKPWRTPPPAASPTPQAPAEP